MRKLGLAVTIALVLFAMVVSLFGSSRPSAANELIRYVPQLELTDLSPVKVVFAPDDDTLLMVVNSHGRVDIFDISNPGRPVKITEIAAGAADAAFTPKGTPREKIKIVSGGVDGTVRLWTLDGKPAAEPFKGHDVEVRSIAFSPDDTRIVSGGGVDSPGFEGTVRLWMLDGKPAAEPFKAHDRRINSVAFSPDGTRIVSGGWDGTIRLWTLEGKPAAEPFKGHNGEVWSVAFSPDGTRIVSGGFDGTIRLWGIAARRSSTLYYCRASLGLGFVHKRFFWIGCSDRISVQSASFEPRGELFLNEEGLFASVYSEGVNEPNDRLQEPFRAIATGGHVIWQRRAVSEVSVERVRQVLFDDWTLRERIYEIARRAYTLANESYAALGWWKVPFWPALGWLIAILAAVGTWIFVPHKLAYWAMTSVGSPEVPTWKWLSGVLTLFGYLGTTRRPLTAWLRKNRGALLEQNFAGRTPVKEREKYCNIIHEADIAAFEWDLSASGSVRVWITGVGGSGKSALAYRMLRVAAEHKTSAPLPILVDEDWDGTLLDHVGQQLTADDRRPTRKMVEGPGR